MAKETQVVGTDGNNEDRILLFTEIMSKILNPKIDKKISSIYKTCFFFLSRTFRADESMRKFVKSSFKQLLISYLQKRASNTLDINFFQTAFEGDLGFALSFSKYLLRCILPEGDARSQFQRLKALELLHYIVRKILKSGDKELASKLEAIFPLLSSSVDLSLQDYKALAPKRTKKCQAYLSLFIDCAKAVDCDKSTQIGEMISIVEKITTEEKDMSNLKGRINSMK